MATSLFDQKDQLPTQELLHRALGQSLSLWEESIAFLERRQAGIVSEWKFYSKKAGWCLKLANSKGKNLLFLLPQDGYFIATVNMGEKLREQVLQLDLQEKNKQLIRDATVYAEGISVLFSIQDADDLADLKLLLEQK